MGALVHMYFRNDLGVRLLKQVHLIEKILYFILLCWQAKWILENGFGGIMVYCLNNDDYLGQCDGKTKFPLVSNITSTVHKLM